MAMKRREFILKLGAAALILPSVLIQACGETDGDDDTSAGDDDTSAGDDDTSAGDDDTASSCVLAEATGSANSHGHNITIPLADLENPPTGGDTYTSTGSHTHTVTLSQQDLIDLATNCSLTTSNSSGHAHTWTITIPQS